MKTICLWCGKSHKRTPKDCSELSKKASSVIKKGVPTWVLMGMLDKFGTGCLDNSARFNTCAEAFAATFGKRKRSLRR